MVNAKRMRRALACLMGLPLVLGAVSAFTSGGAGAEAEVYSFRSGKAPADYLEPGFFTDAVAKGELPPVGERLPETPAVMPMDGFRVLGEPGGSLDMLVGNVKDTKLIGVYGYARLVGYNSEFELEADILESLEVEEGRIFTLKLRKGHRWSDGAPFTTEDFRYFWEDVALNEELYPAGPPKLMVVDDELPKVEVLDETTIRYSWPKPNPFLLPSIAGAAPFYLYLPAHYLKQFHVKYAETAKLETMVKEGGVRNWAQLHNKLGKPYKFQNPDLPTLQPWRLMTAPPARRFIAERNPYYHRVDEAGLQLPYIDRMVLRVTSGALIPAKVSAGESTLQARGLNFRDTPFLKEGEERGNYRIDLWNTARGSQLALYPNLSVEDPVWRALNRDVRYRRALSISVDRNELNQVIYYGTGIEGNNTVLPGSPLYQEAYRTAWTQYDTDAANALLDEIGLTERGPGGIRLLSDGRPLEIIVETAGEDTEETDVLELIGDSWSKVGIKLFVKPLQRELLRNRIFSGQTVMTLWFGVENGIPNAFMSPELFVPVQQHSYQWPMWGQYHETSGKSGEAVDMEPAQELMSLYEAWMDAQSRKEKLTQWQRILEINAEQVYTIGLVAGVPQPVVRSNALHNLPEKAVYNWDPGAHFGVYRLDCAWLEG